MHQEAELSYGNKRHLIKQITETLVSKVINLDKERSLSMPTWTQRTITNSGSFSVVNKFRPMTLAQSIFFAVDLFTVIRAILVLPGSL